ncbi:MAG: glycerate 2-kinase [Thermoplasmata archaeon]|jgi:glycerate-2-kinase|nr:glycerate 2-kinase [Thermoplasmata archaeon]
MRTWLDAARDDVRAILGAALMDATPQKLLRAIRRDGDDLVLPEGARVKIRGRAVRCLAIGKAAGGMAAHAQPWGPFADALVVAPHEVDVPGFACIVGGHPTPTAGSVEAGERALALAQACGPDDLLLVLLSGGASALCEAPAVPLADLARVNDLLLRADAPIEEVNTVRRHLSRLKGGGLARACRGEILLLAISDVEPGDLASLGSGPVSADPTTFADARDVLARHGLLDAVPASVRRHLQAAQAETAKPGDPALARVRAHVLADNETALRAAAREAARRGYETKLLPGWLRGEARERGRELALLARAASQEPGPPLAILAGGETVVRVMGQGTGGRNQELALAAMDGLSGHDALLAALGTDGRDGPTDAAGALVDGRSLARVQALGLDPHAHLEENDSHPVFVALEDTIRTGPTGTNVRDVVVVLVRREET